MPLKLAHSIFQLLHLGIAIYRLVGFHRHRTCLAQEPTPAIEKVWRNSMPPSRRRNRLPRGIALLDGAPRPGPPPRAPAPRPRMAMPPMASHSTRRCARRRVISANARSRNRAARPQCSLLRTCRRSVRSPTPAAISSSTVPTPGWVGSHASGEMKRPNLGSERLWT